MNDSPLQNTANTFPGMQNWGHSKSTSIVQGGGLGSLKSELKRTGEVGDGGQASVCLLCEKNCVIFKHHAVLSEKLLGSCFFVLSMFQHIKVFFIKKA